MPSITKVEHVDPEIFMVHDDITVYHTYADDDFDNGPSMTWFTLSKDDHDRPDFSPVAQVWPLPEGMRKEDVHPGFIDACFSEEEKKRREKGLEAWSMDGHAKWLEQAIVHGLDNGYLDKNGNYLMGKAACPIAIAEAGWLPAPGNHGNTIEGPLVKCVWDCLEITLYGKEDLLVIPSESGRSIGIPGVARSVAWRIRDYQFGSSMEQYIKRDILDFLVKEQASGIDLDDWATKCAALLTHRLEKHK